MNFLMVSVQEKAQLVHGGYIFSCNTTKRGAPVHHYRCATPLCKTSLNAREWEFVISEPKPPHNHEQSNATLLKQLMRWHLMWVIRRNPGGNPDDIVTEGFKHLNAEQSIDAGRFAPARQWVADIMRKMSGIEVTATTIADLVISSPDRLTKGGEDFFLGDSYEDEEGLEVKSPRVIGFSCTSNLAVLKASKVWMAPLPPAQQW